MRPEEPTATALGDRAVVVRLGSAIDAATGARVLDLAQAIVAAALPGVVDVVPAYTSVTVHYRWYDLPEPARHEPWRWLQQRLLALAAAPAGRGRPPRTIELPVCYLPPHAPDLDDVAARTGLTAAAVVERHAGATYRVAFIGFRPGFPYLIGLDPALAVPRLDTPRARVAAGSVGLGGAQTGVYPAAGPGGWRLIGRTPARLFDPDRDPPSLLAAGDLVRFTPVDAGRFEALAAGAALAADAPTASASGPAVLRIGSGGIHASLQDPGRPGWRHLGIGAGGAFDPACAALANLLVGNASQDPVLELAIRGPQLELLRPATVALTGAGMRAQAGGAALPFDRPVALPAGTGIRFQPTGHGARAWLAVAGGFAAPRWFGSASVDAGSGQFGAALAAGDTLHLERPPADDAEAATGPVGWWIESSVDLDQPAMLRFVVDADADAELVADLAGRLWRVAAAADRTGIRLDGAPLAAPAGGSRISAGVLPGTLQLPADGRPILLGPDGQTVGGYPVLGHVIEADLGRMAQLKPGDALVLQPCPLAQAHAARVHAAALLARLALAISGRLVR
jgi:KipI family sensor histidine kinase inhibitor